MADIDELRSAVTGRVLTPADEGYAEAPRSWGPPAHPDVHVYPQTTADVAAVLAWATREGLEVGVRSGGHGAWSLLSGGVLIDLGAFDGIEVEGETVRVGAGCTWGRVADRLVPEGLVISSGDAGTVGVGGNTLGAGVGWLLRSVGLAVDQLVGVEMVTVDGRVVQASATENPELFWALRGGGGNFGIVTRFDFRATRHTQVVFGMAPIETAHLAAVVAGVRDVMRDAPRPLVARVVCPPPAPGGPPPMVQVFWAGADLEEARAAIAPLEEVEGVGGFAPYRVPYNDTIVSPQLPPGPPPRMTGSNGVFAPLTDEVAARAGAAYAAHPMALFEVRYLGGAFGDVPKDATPLVWRDAEAIVHWIAMVPPGSSDADLEAAANVWRPVDDGAAAVLGTFVDGTDEAWVARMYPPEVLQRLRAVKSEWDPGNVLHRNHNIKPL